MQLLIKGGAMEVLVNWWAVILATLASMIVGWIWYSKSVFGGSWMKMVGKSDKDLQKLGMQPMVVALVVSFITAYVLAHVIYLSNAFFHNSFLQDALSTAFWLWLGLVAARMITHDSFEGRPAKLTLLSISHELVTLLAMALVIGLLHP
jgi:hypothetical protein